MNLLQLKQDLEKHFGFTFNINKDLKQGLINTNQAFIQAKIDKSNPQLIAIQISETINSYLKDNNYPYFAINTGPYVNIDIYPDKIQSNFNNFSIPQSESKILLEYISPNVAKELHLGHLRNMNIGDSIRRLLVLKYPNLLTVNHWGDWGVQFGKLIWAYKKFKSGLISSATINDNIEPISFDIYESNHLQGLIRMYVWAEQNKADYPNYDQEVRDEFLALEKGDEENIKLWQEFIKVSKVEVTNDMELFNVPIHMLEQGESYYEKYNDLVYNFFESNKLWQSEDKARFINFELLAELTNNPSIKNLGYGYLISSTGYTTYLFRDICARIDWVSVLESDKMITVTGNEQLHHFKQLNAVCDYISTLQTAFKNSNKLASQNIIHVPYGFLTLAGGSKMSTRKGIIHNARKMFEDVKAEAINNLTLRDTNNIDLKAPIITQAAIKWTDLSKDTIHDIEFDLNSLLSFEGNTGMYQLYTIARINSILNKNPTSSVFDINTLTPDEILIAKQVLLLPFQLNESIDKLKPHYLVNYCYELTNSINSWYNTTSLINEKDDVRKSTLVKLLNTVKESLIYSLDKLGIDTLEEV